MRAGRMDRLITLQSYTETQATSGAITKNWAPIATVWAEKIPIRGAERFVGSQIVAELEAKYRIRFRSDLTAAKGIIDNEEEFDIQSIIELGRKEGLEITAKARGQ